MSEFGVKSNYPANEKLSNGYNFFQWITRKKDVPTFWMRNITGNHAINTQEAMFLKERNCRIGLFLDDFSEQSIASKNGTVDAARAIQAVIDLNVPRYSGIAIFAFIPCDWNINHNWMISFARALCEKGYVPGFFGNTDSSKNFCFDRECGHFIHATHNVNHYCAVYGAPEPAPKAISNGWTPYAPSDLHPNQISLWCGDDVIAFKKIASEPVYAQNESVLNIFW